MIKYFHFTTFNKSCATKSKIVKLLSFGLAFLFFYALTVPLRAQVCESTSAPTPQIGALMGVHFVNLWKNASANDKHGKYYKNNSLSIGDDGWPVDGFNHFIRFYYGEIQPRLKNGDILKVKFKGTAAQAGRGVEACVTQAIQSAGGFTTFEVKITDDKNPNGFVFELKNRCTDIQIMRPGYEFDDPRLLTDESVQHCKATGWKAFRMMGLMGVNGSMDMTWPKRLSKNAPITVNADRTWYVEINGTWAQDKSNGNNENVLGVEDVSGWQRGTSWEDQIDICNYLNVDMWINVPTMVDDDYMENLAKLIKARLKPSLNVNVEIGNEIWNAFGPHFMSGYYMKQILGWEFTYGSDEQKKIFGGALCPGCGLEDNYTKQDMTQQRNNAYDAQQRWQARRLKEHAESFATVYGWKDEGGEVGTKIRMILAGQFYGSNGHGKSIGPGIEFLQKAYGDKAPGKYLYAVALAPYIGPHANPNKETEEQFVNMSFEDIERRSNANSDAYFQEYNELWTTNPRPIYFGNFMEGVFAKARMFGLKFYAYEGGNEMSTGGVDWNTGKGQQWINQKNADQYLSSPRAAALTKRFFDRWYSWFGYDALFMKNGDYQNTPMGGYSMSRTLNEDLPMRNEYIRIGNSPAIPLSKERGNLLNGEPEQILDARKTANYNSDWENNAYGFPVISYGTQVNADYSYKSSNSFEKPFIIRCQKAGKYKFSLERNIINDDLVVDKKWPTFCDIYIDDKLMLAGVSLEADTFSRRIKYDANPDFPTVFHWTNDLILDIPYGVHILRIHPSAPTAARPGNDGYYGTTNRLNNKFDLARYRFRFDAPAVPKKPKGIIGEGATVCKSNSKARYEVQELDMGACEYVWSGLPTGARILPPELVAGSSPAKFLSGQGTYRIFIDWGTVAPGDYELQVLSKNEVGASEPLKFSVKVQICGFQVNPTPACKNEVITFTPEPMAASKFLWDNGVDRSATRFTTKNDASPFKFTYTTPGIYDVTLSTLDAEGKIIKTYRNTVNITACNEPIVATPIRYCKGIVAEPLTAILNSSANPATALRWYEAPTGGTSVASITPPTTTAGTKSYYVSQVYSSGVESDRAKIDVIVADAPAKPQIIGDNPFEFCQTSSSTSIEDLAKKVLWEAGATPRWYTTATGGTSTINPTIPTAGQTDVRIYLSAEKLTCESERAELVISKVSQGIEYIIEDRRPAKCGENGQIVLIGVAPNETFRVSYNLLPEQNMLSSASGRLTLSLPAGTYNFFKVSQGGCSSEMRSPRTIENPGNNSALGGITIADTNILAVGGSTIVRLRNSRGTIKWQVAKGSGPFQEIAGAIKDTINTGALTAGVYTYKVMLIDERCPTPVSSTFSTIKVGQPVNPVAGTAGTTTPQLCSGNTAILTLTGQVGGVQWQDSNEGTTFTDIATATLATYTSPALNSSKWYRAKVTTSEGTIFSNIVSVTVSPSLLNNASSTNFTVIPRQPKSCGALGAIVLKGLRLNTAFKVSYNYNAAVVNTDMSSNGDSIYIPLIKGTYADFKVSLNNCPLTVAGSHTLSDPIAVPLVELVGNSSYCKDQVVNVNDLITRVKAAPGGQLKWYKTIDGMATLQPEAPSTEAVGLKSVWVRQTVSNCDSEPLELKISVLPSSVLSAIGFAPTSCVVADGRIEISGLVANRDYQIEYKKASQSAPIATMKSNAGGKITIGSLTEGIYTSITATAASGNTCLTNSTATIQLAPALAPTLPPTVSGAGEYCVGTPIANVAATANSAGTIDWYNEPTLTTPVANTASFATGQVSGSVTYYAVERRGDCKSPPASVTINIVANPIKQTVIATNATATCNETSYPLSLGDSEIGVVYTIYKDNVLTSISANGTGEARPFPRQSQKGEYTIKAESQGCKADMNGSLAITDAVLPAQFTVSGGATGCEGIVLKVEIMLNNSENNVSYTLIPSDKLLPGSGAGLTFTLPATKESNGSYSISAKNNVTGCTSVMLGTAKVDIQAGVGQPVVAVTPPTACGLSDGKLIIKGLIPSISYEFKYVKEGAPAPAITGPSTSAGDFTIANLGSGVYSVSAVPLAGSSCFANSANDIVIETIGAPRKPEISGAKDYCAGDTKAPLTIASVQPGAVITWYSNADLAIANKVGEGNSHTPTNITATYYAVAIINSCQSPADNATITIVPNPLPQEIAGTGGPASCNLTGYPLKLKTSEVGVKYQFYRGIAPVSVLKEGNGASITFDTISDEGIYTVMAIRSSAGKSCQTPVTGKLAITSPVYPQLFTVSGGATGCDGTVEKADIVLSASEEGVTYTLTPSGKALPGTAAGAALTYPMEAKMSNNGQYLIAAKNNLTGCEINMTDTATIDLKPAVGAPVLTAEATYCNQGESQIKLVASNATSQIWSIVPTTAGTINETTGKVSWLPTYTGPVTINVKVSTSACSTVFKNGTVETQTNGKPVLTLIQGDSLVCRGTEAVYQALPKIAGIKYDWNPGNSVSILENDQINGTVKLKYNEDLGKEGLIITVTPISANCGAGMPVSKKVNKDPSCDLYVPNILTIKDKESANAWHIEGVENYPKITIQIFNRWGTEVHTHKGKYEKPWDGSTNNGQPLPTATYYYVIDKQDGSKTITGSVTVVRD